MNLSAIKAMTGAGKFCTVMNAPDGAEAVRMDAMKLCAPVARWEIERPEVEAEAEEIAEQMGI